MKNLNKQQPRIRSMDQCTPMRCANSAPAWRNSHTRRRARGGEHSTTANNRVSQPVLHLTRRWRPVLAGKVSARESLFGRHGSKTAIAAASSSHAEYMVAPAVPVIDISPFVKDGSVEERLEVAKQLHSACIEARLSCRTAVVSGLLPLSPHLSLL